MSRRLLPPLAVAALLLAAPAAAAVRILAFGDSITLGYGDSATGGGYPQRLESSLRSDGFPVTVRNRGIGGETTAQGLARIGS
ncbi:MAG TPA: GDSL-type esterase/lipase family protein, partial [Thermoanaerobaculia bacterium]|nr:GDSL-type esterase/lipase family protein [Thermoanaerobaculia bacterium]